LRIAVNGEVEGLERLIREAVERLRPAGRLVVIAFHSLEDRAVKHELRRLSDPCVCPPAFPACVCGRPGQLRLITRRPLRPSAAEESDNPRSRSARLRAAEKL
jgi:16S rRNA (cytosine1402-N4)-methyltransferase